MADERKLRYTPPEILPLGEMVRGEGYCFSGTDNTQYGCGTGDVNVGTSCNAGTTDYGGYCGGGSGNYGYGCEIGSTAP